MSENSEFNYFVSAKGIFMVVSMVGQITEQSMGSLEGLIAEVRNQETAAVYIFNLRDVGELTGEAIPMLAQMQRDVRGKPGEVRLCGLRPELKARLLSRGVIRTSEIYDNLQSAILAPARILPKKAA